MNKKYIKIEEVPQAWKLDETSFVLLAYFGGPKVAEDFAKKINENLVVEIVRVMGTDWYYVLLKFDSRPRFDFREMNLS
jgi:hypothetical protein